MDLGTDYQPKNDYFCKIYLGHPQVLLVISQSLNSVKKDKFSRRTKGVAQI